MGLRDLDLRASYDTGDYSLDVVRDFYEPCLDESIKYDRISGFFSSKVLALAARGLGGFLLGNGKMRLITSAKLSPSDLEALENTQTSVARMSQIEKIFSAAMEDRFELEALIERDHLDAMCWLLSKGRLEIRVVIPRSASSQNAMFHSKIGVFTDQNGNAISFSGSMNETLYGWTENIEEFKVFKSWQESSSHYVAHDRAIFEKYWSLTQESDFETLLLPDAIRSKLISSAPADAPNLRRLRTARRESEKNYSLRDYQADAVAAWINSGMRGVLAMATGTGKTKTAVECINQVVRTGPALIVVTAPYQHIAVQWLQDLAHLRPILASGDSDWSTEARSAMSRIRLGRENVLVLVAVQNTAASKKFIEITNELAKNTQNFLFVGDEVHGLGASAFQRALNPSANLRLGLSATPERYFDEIGTDFVLSYFSGTCFEFNTELALSWIDPMTGQTPLCPYEYHPIFVHLSAKETQKYGQISERLAQLGGRDDEPTQSLVERLLFERAAILKKAESKLPALANLLDKMGDSIEDCLIYCNDFEQLNQVSAIVKKRNITFQKITGEEGSRNESRFGNRSEREWILHNFASRKYRVLLAIKCLDEGVDIPSARLGIILASSGNPREFIQRRGRLMRRFEGKEKAVIYDMVVAPNVESPFLNQQEVAIFRKEIRRIDEFSKDAINAIEINLEITRRVGELI